jgi:hypothetical protein
VSATATVGEVKDRIEATQGIPAVIQTLVGGASALVTFICVVLFCVAP